ncbi:MAG: hypothetical protein ACYDBJ_10595 [Aggregatilineales bacterium]
MIESTPGSPPDPSTASQLAPRFRPALLVFVIFPLFGLVIALATVSSCPMISGQIPGRATVLAVDADPTEIADDILQFETKLGVHIPVGLIEGWATKTGMN